MADGTPLGESIARELIERFRPAMQKLAADMRQDLRQRVDVPVGRAPAKRKGGKGRIVRSKPGEPPRKETGAYQASIQSETNVNGTESIRATVFSDTPLAGWLEYGTDRMAPRKHWRTARDRWEREAPERLASQE